MCKKFYEILHKFFVDILLCNGVLKENQSLFLSESNFDNIKHSLMIEKDEHGLYRSMGRLSNANLNFNTKFPVLLHNNDLYLTELIVKYNHVKV